ncbi:MAG: MmcQ/YjbR family DNA-binding protein [Pseudolabrys sp.]|nr:MmcQ/YjbR family DNA-binding protein [Pseudolabrys sp.]
MSTAAQFRRMALALEGTTEAPHFDRAAFKVDRIYATLAADEKSANFKFSPDEQELKCLVAPDAFTAIQNAWGRQGWTTGILAKLTVAELEAALDMAWRHASKPAKRPSTARRKKR